jgi:LPS-assembly lipoprotein
MTVVWRLGDAKTGAAIRTGRTEAAVTYDSADQPYAAIAAQNDGQERAAAEVARKIQLDLATWLAGKKA